MKRTQRRRHMIDVRREGGRDVVENPPSRGLDVIAENGLADALAGVEAVIQRSRARVEAGPRCQARRTASAC